MQPILVRKVVTSAGETVREASPRVRRRVVPAHTARAVAEMLVAVTEGEGTGVEAAVDGYRVAGKTATAQKADPVTGRYSIDRYVASFIGFVPADKPVVAIAVTIDEPMLDHAGGSVAAPLFRRVAQASLKYRGLVPKNGERVDVAQLAQSPDPANLTYEVLRQAAGKQPRVQEEVPALAAIPAGKVRLPDMTGWPARRALQQAMALGLNPRLEGTGLLVTQNPPPGSVLDPGQALLLVFEPAS